MALSHIIERIERDAAEQAEALVRAAYDEAASVLDRATHEAADARATALEQAEKRLASEHAALVEQARLEGRARVLRARRESVDAVFDAVKEALYGLPDERYVALIARMAAAVARDGEVVHVCKGDHARLLGTLPPALRTVGCGIEVVAGDDSGTGVVVLGERMSASVSVESLVSARRDELEVEVARLLFDEEVSG